MSDGIVSDHALLRWLERVHDIDMGYMRSVLTNHVRPYARSGCTLWQAPEANYYFGQRRLLTVLRPGDRCAPRWPGPGEF